MQKIIIKTKTLNFLILSIVSQHKNRIHYLIQALILLAKLSPKKHKKNVIIYYKILSKYI